MKRYGLIGYPLSHSFSEKYFNEKFSNQAIDARYENFEIDNIKKFPDLIHSNPNLFGLNVTSPYKESVIPFLDNLSDEAQTIHAVNCIKISHDNNNIHTKGYNTDIYGFSESIKPYLNINISQALILGTGGAARAASAALEALNIKYTYVSRSPKLNMIAYEAIDNNLLKNTKLIVNASPVGMHSLKNTAPEIPYHYLTTDHIVYDMIYNPAETIFLQKAKQFGAITVNGLSMLKAQAELTWSIFSQIKKY